MTHPLREFRDRHGISLEDLAARLRVSKSTLWRFEAGETKSGKLARRLKAETGLSMDELLAADVEAP